MIPVIKSESIKTNTLHINIGTKSNIDEVLGKIREIESLLEEVKTLSDEITSSGIELELEVQS
ncbi:MAG: hypothetical protein QM793_03465 [Muricomes sp.]